MKHDARLEVWDRSDGRCRYCAIPLTRETFTVDHVIPLARGGTDAPENLVVACRSCNSRKYTGQQPRVTRAHDYAPSPLASWLTRLRAHMGATQFDLSIRLKVSMSCITRWENDQSKPLPAARYALTRLARKQKFPEPMPD